MDYCSHITNFNASENVRTLHADFWRRISHNQNMARRGKPSQVNWYLREWMDTAFPKARGRQARMMELTGWSKATTSQLYNNTQDYSPKLVNEAAKALGVEPYELLMHPDHAMRLRRYIASAEDVVKLAHNNEPELKTGTDGE